jgi:hypothetical protein
VIVINIADEILILDSVDISELNNITLISKNNTNYICSYTGFYTSIINITESRSFAIERGILQHGNENALTSNKFHFTIVDGTDSLMIFFDMEIKFVSKIESLVMILLGGKVILNYVKIDNQLDTMWVHPLIISLNPEVPITVEFHSCNVTNCKYKYTKTNGNSAIVDFLNKLEVQTFFNMSLCTFKNNSFNLNTDGLGSVCGFESSSDYSYYLNFFVIDSTFLNHSHFVSNGGLFAHIFYFFLSLLFDIFSLGVFYISCISSNISIKNSTFKNITALNLGSVIFITAPLLSTFSIIIDLCIFAECTSPDGRAALCFFDNILYSKVNVNRTRFENNKASLGNDIFCSDCDCLSSLESSICYSKTLENESESGSVFCNGDFYNEPRNTCTEVCFILFVLIFVNDFHLFYEHNIFFFFLGLVF